MTSPEVEAPRPTLGRRELLAGAGAAAVVGLFAGPGRGALDVLPFIGAGNERFDRTPIAEHIGETFRVVTGPVEGVTVQIAEVLALSTGEIADAEQQFAVRFVQTGGVALAQDTYEFATGSWGGLPLFVSPITDQGETSARYEAIVNRHVPDDAARGSRP